MIRQLRGGAIAAVLSLWGSLPLPAIQAQQAQLEPLRRQPVMSRPVMRQSEIAQPAQVILIRHGHKDGDAANFNLSPQGLQRSLALASLIPACFGRVSRIVVYRFDPESGKNARSYQSAVPLAVQSGVNIRIASDSESGSLLAGRRIRAEVVQLGGTAVLFWEHRRLPALAAGLGWPAMPAIADDDFDGLVLLRFGAAGAAPSVRLYSQARLLAGSQPCSAPPSPAPAAPLQ